jgi:P2-related tail formation protein
MDRSLGSSLNSKTHLSVFYDIINDRLADIDLSVILMNMLDTAPANALPSLAKQYNVNGYRGWMFMTTETQKRELLKFGTRLGAKSGTPWSIKEALRIAGYPGVTFQEGIARKLDGTWDLDGSNTLGSEDWAKFYAYVPVATPGSVPSSVTELITAIINEYKPARSHLETIIYTQL